jgi:hypothetical protein
MHPFACRIRSPFVYISPLFSDPEDNINFAFSTLLRPLSRLPLKRAMP